MPGRTSSLGQASAGSNKAQVGVAIQWISCCPVVCPLAPGRSGRCSARRPSEVDGARREVEGAWERIFTRRGGCRPARHLKWTAHAPDAFPSGRRVGVEVSSVRRPSQLEAPRTLSEMDGAPCWRAPGCGAFFGEVRSISSAPSEVDGARHPEWSTHGGEGFLGEARWVGEMRGRRAPRRA